MTDDAGMIGDFEGLVQHFRAKGLDVLPDPRLQGVEVPTHILGQDTRTVVVWPERAPVLQVIQVLLEEPFDRLEGPLLEAIARVNHALMLPGFGFDFVQRMVYYRWTVPRRAEGLTGLEVDQAVDTVLFTSRDVLPALARVATGELAPELVMSAVGPPAP